LLGGVVVEIKISLKMPAPSESVKQTEKPVDLFIEKVYDYLYKCESSVLDSSLEFKYLKSVYKKLTSVKQLNPCLKPVLKKLEDFMVKQSFSEDIPLDSSKMNRWE